MKEPFDTEADHYFGQEKAEFCCNRENTYESAHDMSAEESHRIITRILGSDTTRTCDTSDLVPDSDNSFSKF